MYSRRSCASYVGADAHIDPADRTVFTRICGEFVTSQWADRVVGPYRARRRFAAAHRAEQSPAPTKAWANPYCFADFERKAFYRNHLNVTAIKLGVP